MGSRWQTGVVHSPSGWRARLAKRIDPATVRNRVENVNDGILAIAGFSEGLAGGGEIQNL